MNVKFDDYDKHMKEHKDKIEKIEEEKDSTSTIPCDICKMDILFKEYADHINAHNNPEPEIPQDTELKDLLEALSPSPVSNPIPGSSPNPNLIPINPAVPPLPNPSQPCNVPPPTNPSILLTM